MIQDDQIAESGKSARKRDDAVVDRRRPSRPSGAAISMPLRRRDRRWPKRPPHLAVDRPVEIAAERAQRQRGRLRPAAPRRSAISRSIACSFCCAVCSSPASCAFRSRSPIDVADEVGARLRGALRRGLRLFGAALRSAASSARRCSSAARVALQLGRASAGATRRGRDRAWRAPRPSASPGRAAGGPASRGAAADSAPGRACRSRPAARAAPAAPRAPTSAAPASARSVAASSASTFAASASTRFSSSARSCRSISSLRRSPRSVRSCDGEAIGFALQRLQPLGRAPRERLGARAVGLLGGCDARRQQNRKGRRDRRETELGVLSGLCVPPAPRSDEPLRRSAFHRYHWVSARRSTSTRSARYP